MNFRPNPATDDVHAHPEVGSTRNQRGATKVGRHRWRLLAAVGVAVASVLAGGATPAVARTGSIDDIAGVEDEIRELPQVRDFVFWGPHMVGYWYRSGFHYQSPTQRFRPGLVGTSVLLHNTEGTAHVGQTVRCGRAFGVWPMPPEGNVDEANYWFTSNAPVTVDTIDAGYYLDDMYAALAERGLNPAYAHSYGAPLSGEGSAERLVWYHTNEFGPLTWIATFNPGTGDFRTVWGDPAQAPSEDSSAPSAAFVDLDQDGNLESIIYRGFRVYMYEWATGLEVWSAPIEACNAAARER